MFKVALMTIAFLKEIIFESKDEYDLTSSKFSFRKVGLFIFAVILVFYSIFITYRLASLASDVVVLRKQNADLNVKINSHKQSSE